MIFVEITKFIKSGKFDLEDPLHRWIKFLADPEYINNLPMERKHNYPNLKKAVEILDEASLTPAQQRGYDQYLDGISYWNGTMIESFDNGYEKGVNQIIPIIHEIKAGQKTLEEIANDFKMPIENVLQLKNLL